MVRCELDRAGGGERLGARQIRGPVEHDRTADGAAQRAAHALPCERRASVQHETARIEFGNKIARAAHIRKHRLGGEHAAERLRVRALYGLVEREAGRRPVDVRPLRHSPPDPARSFRGRY